MRKPAMKLETAKEDGGEMRPEYDFSGAERGRYLRRYQESSNVVVLDPDIAEGFRNSEAVNSALRALLRVAKESQDPQKGSKVSGRSLRSPR